ncbi:MAG: sensor histidine kinase [Solirubrobacterales bacterium]
MIRRLPIRLTLTLAFTFAMALVLTATAFFLYLRLRTELDNRLDQTLHTHLQVVSTQLQAGGGGRRAVARAAARGEEGSGIVEVLAPGGNAVLGAREALGDKPLLGAGEIRRLAADGGGAVDLRSEQPELGAVRLLVKPVTVDGGQFIVAVGVTLEDRNEALANLRALLLVGEPVALMLAALAAWAVVGAALRPVNEMLVRLEDGLRRERTFVADASHELRTPLTMLKMELELMRKDRPSGPEFDQALTGAIGDTDRLASLTDDLLLLARSDRDRLPLTRERVSVQGLLGKVAERYPADQVQVAPIPASGAPPETIWGDPGRLARALANLVENALRHGAPPVLLRAAAREGWVELHVSDEGPGFPPEFLPHAFDRFSQAEPGDGGAGTGLGLAIVSAIAGAHGGTAKAKNLGSGGADVWIELPGDAAPPESTDRGSTD